MVSNKATDSPDNGRSSDPVREPAGKPPASPAPTASQAVAGFPTVTGALMRAIETDEDGEYVLWGDVAHLLDEPTLTVLRRERGLP